MKQKMTNLNPRVEATLLAVSRQMVEIEATSDKFLKEAIAESDTDVYTNMSMAITRVDASLSKAKQAMKNLCI